MFSPKSENLGFVCCVVVLIFVLSPSASAQSTSGRIIGRVADSTGAVVSGVTVTLVNDATRSAATQRRTTTGDYTFIEVPLPHTMWNTRCKDLKKTLPRM